MTRRPTVAVLRALGLGDTVAALPALRLTARALPDHRMVVLVSEAMRPLIGAAIPGAVVLPTRGLTGDRIDLEPPEVLVNMHGRGPVSTRMALQVQPFRLVSFEDRRMQVAGPAWSDAEHEVERWCRLVRSVWPVRPCADDDALPTTIRGRIDPPTVLVHPGAASASRRWFPRRFAAVADAFSSAGCRVRLTGGPHEAARCRRVADQCQSAVDVSAVGATSLSDLCRMVASAQLVVSGDTGVAHLAYAYRTPSVTLFGPVSPSLWGPRDRRRHAVIWHADDQEEGRPGDAAADHIDRRLADIGPREVVDAGCALLEAFAGDPLRAADLPSRLPAPA